MAKTNSETTKTPEAPKASVGRIVVYVDPQMGDSYPAIITNVGGDEQVLLTAFQPNAVPFPVRGAVAFDPKKARGTWHWPEKI